MQSKLQYIRDKRSPAPKNSTTSKVMSRNKAKNTKPETAFRTELRKHQLTGYRLHPKNVIGRPDICFVSKKIAIFINGCFWHRCPKCNYGPPKNNTEFWNNKFKANVERDNRKTTELEKQGWKVLTIWECDIKKNLDLMVEIVKDIVHNNNQGD